MSLSIFLLFLTSLFFSLLKSRYILLMVLDDFLVSSLMVSFFGGGAYGAGFPPILLNLEFVLNYKF